MQKAAIFIKETLKAYYNLVCCVQAKIIVPKITRSGFTVPPWLTFLSWVTLGVSRLPSDSLLHL